MEYNAESKEWLVGLLKDGNVEVTFTKTDGSERKMLCTLNENAVPSEKSPKKTGKKQNPDVQVVFDVEKQEWRSFRWDSVKEIYAVIV